MPRLQPINPVQLGAPRGYSNGILVDGPGRLLFVAGQVAWDERQQLVGETFSEQFERALANVLAVVQEAGGDAGSVARLTLYVTDRREYLAELAETGAAYRRLMGRRYPAMALVEVQGLLEPGAKVEIEATAVVASGDPR